MSFSRLSLKVLMVMTLLAVSAFALAGGITGTYQIGTPKSADDNVEVSIALSLVNGASSEVSNATITLHDPSAARVTYGDLTGISLPANGQVEVNGVFTVPQSLYDSWKSGSTPTMSVNYSDAHGKPVRTFIQF